MTTVTLALVAYLIGSISFAVVASRAFGLPDPRSYGSHNPGATNVLRTGRKARGAAHAARRQRKGWLAVFIAAHFAEADALELDDGRPRRLPRFVGHMFPVFFRFQGGKGVSTALGVLFALNLYLAARTLATWLIIAAFFRISSLAALVAALFAPFFTLILYQLRASVFLRRRDRSRRCSSGGTAQHPQPARGHRRPAWAQAGKPARV